MPSQSGGHLGRAMFREACHLPVQATYAFPIVLTYSFPSPLPTLFCWNDLQFLFEVIFG